MPEHWQYQKYMKGKFKKMNIITSELMSILIAPQIVKSQFEYPEVPEPEPGTQPEKVLPKPASSSFLTRFFKRLNRNVEGLNQVFYPSEYKASGKKVEDC